MQGVGVGITALRRGAVLASVALRRRLLVTLEINNRDRAYDWFLAWLAHQQRTTRRPAWAHSHQLSVETAYAQHKNGSADVLFKLVAGPGLHWLKYRGAWMQVRIHSSPPPPHHTHPDPHSFLVSFSLSFIHSFFSFLLWVFR
jgi:chaperone BCS1